jgi:general secretion pathway protein D
VVVRDQQTVVIGGLMRDQVTTSTSKVPVLGDIPLIGALFRTKEQTKTKKNLLLFLTPYIIRSPADLRAIYERKIRERQEFVDRYFVFTDSEYEAPVDYSRTRGLLGEMIRELTQQDAERKLALEAANKPELGHEPQPPVGGAETRVHGDPYSSPDAPGPGQPAPLPSSLAPNAPPPNAPPPEAPPPSAAPAPAPEAPPPPIAPSP